MKQWFKIAFIFAIIFGMLACSETQEEVTEETTATNWEQVKKNVAPKVMLTDEFGTPYRQPISTIGWEDSLCITADGLALYCTYSPSDIFSFILFGQADQANAEGYIRGDTLGMDIEQNPLGYETWIHADIVYAYRETTDDVFSDWILTQMNCPVYSETSLDVQLKDNGEIDFITYVTNQTSNYGDDIAVIWNPERNPDELGEFLPEPINHSDLRESNPNMVRMDGDHLIIYYVIMDTSDKEGNEDIFFSQSFDNGITWEEPIAVADINTASQEDMPFYYIDGKGQGWLYFAASSDNGKMEIYRAKQKSKNNFTDYGERECVIAAGNAFSVGEPTLTEDGDLSFVVVYDAGEDASQLNRFDADPWYVERK
jgi:hypothetical protein